MFHILLDLKICINAINFIDCVKICLIYDKECSVSVFCYTNNLKM